jgi:hypothetical protein
MRARACLLLPLIGLVACARNAPPIDTSQQASPPMAAASGVARADGGLGPRDQRVIPLRPMSGDVEILYGDPEAAGEPFVMRIRELPGTIVPPHSHPVDEHITVVQGTWYFGWRPIRQAIASRAQSRKLRIRAERQLDVRLFTRRRDRAGSRGRTISDPLARRIQNTR